MKYCNNEARRAMENVENKMKAKDFEGARKFALKARQQYPHLEDISQLLMVCNVHCSARTKLNGGNDMDFYGILQIERFSDEDTIKKQYKKLALLLHPDKNRFPGAEVAFKLIGEANGVLTDPTKRSLYDMKCRATVTLATPKQAFHQSNQFFYAMKVEGNLNEDSLVPCSQHTSLHTCRQLSSRNVSDRSLGCSIRLDARKKVSVGRSLKEDVLKKGNASENGIELKPPKKASRRNPEIESSGGFATGVNDDVSRSKKTKESGPMPKPESLKPKENKLKASTQANAKVEAGKESFTIVLGLCASSRMRKAKNTDEGKISGKGSTSSHGGGGITLKSAKHLNGEKKEPSMKKQKRVSSEEVNGEGNEGNLKKKKRGLVNEEINGEDMELIEKKYPYLFSSLEAVDLSKRAKDRANALFGLIGEEKLIELDQEWRNLMQAKLELFVKEKELIAKQLMLGLDAVKSQN